MPEDTAARAVRGQGHAAEMAALDAGNPVVRGQTLVQPGMVGGQEIEDAAVPAQDTVEEQLGLADQPLPQRLVERQRIGIAGTHRGVGEIAQLQPLAREVTGQRRRPGVGDHPPDLPLELGRIGEPPRVRRRQQRVVGQAAPQEEREPGGELEVRHRIRAAGHRVDGIRLESEQEVGARQQVAQRALDASLEVLATGPRVVVEPAQQRDVGGGGGPAIGAPREPGQDLGGARRLAGGGLRRAEEDAPAAGGVARPAIAVRPADGHAADDGDGTGNPTAPRVPERIPHLLDEGLGPAEEGDADVVGAGRHRRAHDQPAAREICAVVARRPRLSDRHQGDLLAVHRHFQAVGGPAAPHPPQLDLDLVVGVPGKQVGDPGAAPRPEGQGADPIVLRLVGGDAIGVGSDAGWGAAHREPAHPPSRRQIPFEQRFRQAQGHPDVVEPVAGIVGRQQVIDLHLDRQQIPHHVPVLGPIEPVHRGRATRIRPPLGRRVEPAFEPAGQVVQHAGLGPGAAGRRHHARPELADDPLPDLGVLARRGRIEGVQHQPRRPQLRDERRRPARPAADDPRAVAGDAVPVQHVAVDGGRGLRGRRLGRCRQPLGGPRRVPAEQSGDQRAGRRQPPCGHPIGAPRLRRQRPAAAVVPARGRQVVVVRVHVGHARGQRVPLHGKTPPSARQFTPVACV